MITTQEAGGPSDSEEVRGLSDDEDCDLLPVMDSKMVRVTRDSQLGLLVSGEQSASLHDHGYCRAGPDHLEPLTLHQLKVLIAGWTRPLSDVVVSIEIHNIIIAFSPFCPCDDIIRLQSGGDSPVSFLLPKASASLSKLIIVESAAFELKQVPPDTLEHVVKYLGHHKGKEPDPLPCPVRGVSLSQNVHDQWDATFMDDFDKKTVFEIILAANHMDIKSLLHLGCAKIAMLIKQLDQTEINRIVEEEERYRREHAPSDPADHDDDDRGSETADSEQDQDDVDDDEDGDLDGNVVGGLLRQISGNQEPALVRRMSASIIAMTSSVEVDDEETETQETQ